MSGPILELRVALTVDDLDRALALWRDALGLHLSHAWGEGEARGAVLEASARATIELLSLAEAAKVDRAETGRTTGAAIRLALQVPDSASLSAQLVAAGAGADGGVVETPWGHRNVRLSMPDGLAVTLFTETKKNTD